jgi:hypothetical protein
MRMGLATMRMGIAWFIYLISRVKLSFYYILKNKKTKVLLLTSLKNSILEGNYVILH